MALEKICQYHCLLSDEGQPGIEIRGEFGYFTTERFSLEPISSRHASEAMFCSIINSIRHFTNNNNLHPVKVRFSHPQPGDITEHQRIFSAPLLFKQPGNELVIDRKHLDMPILLANPELLETLEKHAQKLLDRLYSPNTLADKVVHLLGKMLKGEAPSIQQVAGKLAMSTRNLQNKLKKERTTYQKLLDQVRKEIAISYLKKPEVAIIDIAFHLGFSEQSVFNHAFKRWTGSTPHKYR